MGWELLENKKPITQGELERLYWQEGKSMQKIADEFGCSLSRIFYQMNKFGIKRRSRSEASKTVGIRPPTHFVEVDVSPSEDLAYILGVLKGDGCAYIKKGKQSGVVQLSQIRQGFAKSFGIALKNLGFNPSTFIAKSRGCKNGILYVTYGNSYQFVKWYKQLSFEDIEKILGKNPDFIKAFIRGFFESEGTNSIKKRKKYNSIKWQVGIAGREKDLYDFVEMLLKKIGFNFKRYCHNVRGKPLHILKSSDQRQNYRFIKEIAPCIKNRIIEPTAKIDIDWTKEKIVEELKKFVEVNCYSPAAHDVPDSLRGACERHFGTFNKAKEAAGIRIYPIGYNLEAKTGRNSWQTRRLLATD